MTSECSSSTTNSLLVLQQIIEDCYKRKSVIATSQLPIAKWYDYINEPILAGAITNRLYANAHLIELKGDSLRRKNQKKLKGCRSEKQQLLMWFI